MDSASRQQNNRRKTDRATAPVSALEQSLVQPAPSSRLSQPTPYNFRRPDKFSRDHLRAIQTLHESFDRAIAQFLSAKVRMSAHVEVASLEQITVGDFLEALPGLPAVMIAELAPVAGSVILVIESGLALTVVDRLLGGSGITTAPRPGRRLSEIEALLIGDVAAGLLDEFVKGWQQIAPLEVSARESLLSIQQLPRYLDTEPALIVRHEVDVLGTAGWVSFCLPAATVEPLLPRLASRSVVGAPRVSEDDQWTRDLTALLDDVRLQVRVELGRTTVRLADLLVLEPGDVIRLDTDTSRPLRVLVEDQCCFLAQPGRKAGALAVRIIERVAGVEPERGGEQSDERE